MSTGIWAPTMRSTRAPTAVCLYSRQDDAVTFFL